MIVSAIDKRITNKGLLSYIKDKAPDYSSRLFGLGKDKSIIVRKSAFVAVQVSKYNHEIRIDGALPSPILSALSSFLFIEGLGYLFQYIFYSQWKNLEAEIGSILKVKYC